MPRVFGVLAIFGGWLSILAGAVFGLIATQFLDLDHIEGALPPSGVYGVPSVAVLWIAVGTAVITAVPAGAAMFARDPSRRLYVAAAVMAGVGVVLLPDDLGRAYAAALIPGAMRPSRRSGPSLRHSPRLGSRPPRRSGPSLRHSPRPRDRRPV